MAVVLVSKLNNMNDTYPGAGSPSGIQSGGVVGVQGLVGHPFSLTSSDALKYSDTAIGTLYGGVYVIVKLKAGQTASVKGGLAFFDVATLTTPGFMAYQVLTAVTAPTMGQCCGVFLNVVDAGKYGIIQLEGIATVLCATTVGGSTAGDLALVDPTPTGTVVAVADGTAGGTDTAGEAKRILGTFLEAPADASLKRIQLENKGFFPAVGTLY